MERRRGQTLPLQTLRCVAPWTDSVGIDAKMPFDLLGVVVGMEGPVATFVIEPLIATSVLVVRIFGPGTFVIVELALVSKLE